MFSQRYFGPKNVAWRSQILWQHHQLHFLYVHTIYIYIYGESKEKESASVCVCWRKWFSAIFISALDLPLEFGQACKWNLIRLGCAIVAVLPMCPILHPLSGSPCKARAFLEWYKSETVGNFEKIPFMPSKSFRVPQFIRFFFCWFRAHVWRNHAFEIEKRARESREKVQRKRERCELRVSWSHVNLHAYTPL